MGETYNDLAWKNDNPFFIDLNKNIGELRSVFLEGNKDLSKMEKYFNQVNSVKVFYSAYIDGSKDYIEPFQKSQDFIKSIEFYKFIGKQKKKPEDYEKPIEALKNLNLAVENMLYNLSENNILPKVHTKKKYDPKTAISQTTY